MFPWCIILNIDHFLINEDVLHMFVFLQKKEANKALKWRNFFSLSFSIIKKIHKNSFNLTDKIKIDRIFTGQAFHKSNILRHAIQSLSKFLLLLIEFYCSIFKLFNIILLSIQMYESSLNKSLLIMYVTEFFFGRKDSLFFFWKLCKLKTVDIKFLTIFPFSKFYFLLSFFLLELPSKIT